MILLIDRFVFLFSLIKNSKSYRTAALLIVPATFVAIAVLLFKGLNANQRGLEILLKIQWESLLKLDVCVFVLYLPRSYRVNIFYTRACVYMKFNWTRKFRFQSHLLYILYTQYRKLNLKTIYGLIVRFYNTVSVVTRTYNQIVSPRKPS